MSSIKRNSTLGTKVLLPGLRGRSGRHSGGGHGYFGLPLSGAAADAMRSLVRADPFGRGAAAPGARYALADFGLTGEEVDERSAAIPSYQPSKR